MCVRPLEHRASCLTPHASRLTDWRQSLTFWRMKCSYSLLIWAYPGTSGLTASRLTSSRPHASSLTWGKEWKFHYSASREARIRKRGVILLDDRLSQRDVEGPRFESRSGQNFFFCECLFYFFFERWLVFAIRVWKVPGSNPTRVNFFIWINFFKYFYFSRLQKSL